MREMGVGLLALMFVGLTLYLESGTVLSTEEKAAFEGSAEARAYMTASAQAWGAAHEASGAAPEEAAAAAAATTAFYVPPADAGSAG